MDGHNLAMLAQQREHQQSGDIRALNANLNEFEAHVTHLNRVISDLNQTLATESETAREWLEEAVDRDTEKRALEGAFEKVTGKSLREYFGSEHTDRVLDEVEETVRADYGLAPPVKPRTQRLEGERRRKIAEHRAREDARKAALERAAQERAAQERAWQERREREAEQRAARERERLAAAKRRKIAAYVLVSVAVIATPFAFAYQAEVLSFWHTVTEAASATETATRGIGPGPSGAPLTP